MTTDDAVHVGIDQGSHATRAVAYDAAGRCLATAFVSVDTDRPAAGRVEHDGERLVAGLHSVLDDLALHVPATRWRAAGLAVQRSTVACWDRDSGALLAPLISWQDRRQAGWLEGLAAQAARVHDLTGLPLSPHYGASKLRWCLEHLPDVAVARDTGRLCCGPLASLLLARLVEGRPCLCDESSASRTQLWSPHERRWSPELLELFGVPPQVLPQLAPTGADFGLVRVGDAHVPLRACTGDQAAVPFAAGPLEAGTACVNLGTGAFLLLPVAQALRAAPLLTSVLWSSASGVAYALEGTVNGAGSALAWFAREEGLPVERMLPTLDREPLPGEDAPLFLNGVSGIGSPFWVPFFESRYVGGGDATARLGAVVESIGFLLKANLDVVSRHADRPSRLVVSGGLARSDFLMRLLASLSGVPAWRLVEAEATARGAAFLAAGQPADWLRPPLQAFAPAAEPALQSRYARWRELLDAAIAA